MNPPRQPLLPHSDSTSRQYTKAHSRARLPHGLMQEESHAVGGGPHSTLSSEDYARHLIRLIQCPTCSKPYNNPVTLPCGRSICRSCLPDSHERERITWPDLPDRRRAIKCPFEVCGEEHTNADCSVDVALAKVMESIAEAVAKQNSIDDLSKDPQVFEAEVTQYSAPDAQGHVQIESRGRLIATYNAAASGQLHIDADISIESVNFGHFGQGGSDNDMLSHLLETCQKELDCQVCYNLMLDPVTTSCGHTLCRKCLIRSLDHSLHCPVCRRMILAQPSLLQYPSNKTINDLLDGLCPDIIATRREAVANDEAAMLGEFDTALFVVALGFPNCPTFLRIFEPRYRLMLRRALEGNRTFGIVMYNSYGSPQGELGRSQYMQYGTLLRIENAQLMPDGTSIVETRGVSRFKVLNGGSLDGYSVGRVERVEDIPLAEEEAMEIRETSLPPTVETDIEGQITRTSTEELLNMALAFVTRMQGRSAPWLHEGILQAYGGPPSNAATFPYWFASILPISEHAKYSLLHTTSVRQRLKITARWVKLMEQQRWYHSNSCNVL